MRVSAQPSRAPCGSGSAGRPKIKLSRINDNDLKTKYRGDSSELSLSRLDRLSGQLHILNETAEEFGRCCEVHLKAFCTTSPTMATRCFHFQDVTLSLLPFFCK